MKSKITRRGFCAGAAAIAVSPAVAGSQAHRLPEYRRGGMYYRPLGKTGIDVSILSFGSHTDPKDRVKNGDKGTALTEVGQSRRDRMVSRAFDLGVNLLDVYANEGQWEPAAKLVKGRREKVAVSLAHDITPAGIDAACRLFGHVDLLRFHTGSIDGRALEDWEVLRRAKEAGKVRAIGIATHVESTMASSLQELEGIDFLFFPYNFIHARADYSGLLLEAEKRNVGLIGMKPLASGSIAKLDPLARGGTNPEFDALQLWQTNAKPILPAAVAELTRSLNRLPEETLCMSAMRFAYSQRFLATAITGMFDERLLEDNYRALVNYREISGDAQAALKTAKEVAALTASQWLPKHYRWLDEEWRG